MGELKALAPEGTMGDTPNPEATDPFMTRLPLAEGVADAPPWGPWGPWGMEPGRDASPLKSNLSGIGVAMAGAGPIGIPPEGAKRTVIHLIIGAGAGGHNHPYQRQRPTVWSAV